VRVNEGGERSIHEGGDREGQDWIVLHCKRGVGVLRKDVFDGVFECEESIAPGARVGVRLQQLQMKACCGLGKVAGEPSDFLEMRFLAFVAAGRLLLVASVVLCVAGFGLPRFAFGFPRVGT
jgi:hypothetical protein